MGGEVLSMLATAVHARVPTATLARMPFAYPTFPAITQDLIHHPDFDRTDLSTIRLVNDTGPPETMRQVQERFAPAPVVTLFGMTEAYLIENGEITEPLREGNLIGNGPEVLTRIDALAGDFAMGPPGTCGKDGQGVPVGDGQPTLRVKTMTIGGGASLHYDEALAKFSGSGAAGAWRVASWVEAEEAKREIVDSIARFQRAQRESGRPAAARGRRPDPRR